MERQIEKSNKLSGKMIALMAVASGIAVANIYYIQPLLNSAAEYFNSTGSQASLLATLTQTGYTLGSLVSSTYFVVVQQIFFPHVCGRQIRHDHVCAR